MKKIKLLSLIIFIFIENFSFSQQTFHYKDRALWSFGLFGGLGFSTLHEDNISYQTYDSSSGTYIHQKTLARAYFAFSFGLFSDIYIDSNKTFGLGIDISYTRMGFRDDLYEKYYRIYYLTLAPKIISWTEKNFYISAGFYWGFALLYTKDSKKELFNFLDYGILIDCGFIQQTEKTTTRSGFKIYLGLKNVFKEWNIVNEIRGKPEGKNFTVIFYLSFIFNILN